MGVCDGDTRDFIYSVCAVSQGMGRPTWDHYAVSMCLWDLQKRRLKHVMELITSMSHPQVQPLGFETPTFSVACELDLNNSETLQRQW